MKTKIPEAMNYTLCTIVDQETYDALRILTKKHDRTMQGEIGVAVKEYVTSNCPPAERTVGPPRKRRRGARS